MLHAARVYHAYKDLDDIRKVFLLCKGGERTGGEYKGNSSSEYKGGDDDIDMVSEESLQQVSEKKIILALPK